MIKLVIYFKLLQYLEEWRQIRQLKVGIKLIELNSDELKEPHSSQFLDQFNPASNIVFHSL